MKVNGKTVNLEKAMTLKTLLNNGYDLPRIAVELNGTIVPKASYDEVMLSPEDTIEIVRFVGGG